jgi:flagellar motor protein MotB
VRGPWRLTRGAALALAVLTSCSASPSEPTSRTTQAPTAIDEEDGLDKRADVPEPPAERPRKLDLPTAAEVTLDLPARRSPARFDFPGVEIEVEDVGGDRCELLVTMMDEAIGFARNSAEIPPGGHRALQLVAALLMDVDGPITLRGHSSTEGDSGWNWTLSELRVTAVTAILQELIGPAADLRPEPHGDTDPLVFPDDTEAKREQNRRVEITAELEPELCDG